MKFFLDALLLEWREYFHVLWQDAERAQRAYEIAIQQSSSSSDGGGLIAENVATEVADEALEANIVKLHELAEAARHGSAMEPLLPLKELSIERDQWRIKSAQQKMFG